MEQKRELVVQFQKEGGSAWDFSQKEQLTYSAFLKWIKQVPSEPGAWLPVRVRESSATLTGPVMELHLACGRKLHLLPGFDAQAVRQLIRLVEQAC